MRLKNLELKQFRNLASQTVSFSERVTLITGKNGQGKTSLLEAIYLLGQSKSFREFRAKELVCWGSNNQECQVDSTVDTEDGTKNVSYKVINGSRQVFINKERVKKASNFYGLVKSVEFIPDDLQLIKGEPSLRRRFIDKVLAMVDKNYVDSLVHYQRALKNRNALLKSFFKNGSKPSTHSELIANLAPWDSALAGHGREVCIKRLAFVKAIESLFVLILDSCLG